MVGPEPHQPLDEILFGSGGLTVTRTDFSQLVAAKRLSEGHLVLLDHIIVSRHGSSGRFACTCALRTAFAKEFALKGKLTLQVLTAVR